MDKEMDRDPVQEMLSRVLTAIEEEGEIKSGYDYAVVFDDVVLILHAKDDPKMQATMFNSYTRINEASGLFRGRSE